MAATFGATGGGVPSNEAMAATATLGATGGVPQAAQGETLAATFGATGNVPHPAAREAMKLCFGETLGATGDMPPVAPQDAMSTTFGGTLGATGSKPSQPDGGAMGSTAPLGATGCITGDTLKVTLGAAGGAGPMDASAPVTPSRTAAVLRAALDEEEAGEPVSPSLMSVCGHLSPAAMKRDPNASFGDSPSIVILEDARESGSFSKGLSSQEEEEEAHDEQEPMHAGAHWTPCKSLSRQHSPRTPRTPRSRSKKDRPIRCRSPEPLSARGRERHMQEMAALGLQGGGARSARGPRPRGRGMRHVAVAGGA